MHIGMGGRVILHYVHMVNTVARMHVIFSMDLHVFSKTSDKTHRVTSPDLCFRTITFGASTRRFLTKYSV